MRSEQAELLFTVAKLDETINECAPKANIQQNKYAQHCLSYRKKSETCLH